MDTNIVVLCGRLAAPADLRIDDSGGLSLHLLVSIHAPPPRSHVDVIAVTLWDPEPRHIEDTSEPGVKVWISGMVRRRFEVDRTGRRSRIEIVAHHVEIANSEETANWAGGSDN